MAINPKAKEIEVGVRTMRKVTIFPLSLADQMTMGDIIADAVKEFLAKRQEFAAMSAEGSSQDEQVSFVSDIIEVVKKNIIRILELVTDKTDTPKLEELDNEQLVEIADLIFSMNYETAAKNVQSLLRRAKGAFGWKNSQPDSSAGIPSMISPTSSEDPTLKED